ncbi:serine O-acetyltransferase [Aureimonas sp. AU4]|uniref:serine O-acetyltransferase n=1 Tax=Aureimonas sp. AU4 TaxID=1638163 RepID=UPI000783C037|nr:serine acetyltransferase [Aureimonas sp. AU4]
MTGEADTEPHTAVGGDSLNRDGWRAVFGRIRDDIAIYARVEGVRPGAAFVTRLIFVTPGFQFVLARRIQEMVVLVPLVGRPLRWILWWASCLAFGSELAPSAVIGGGLYTPHPFSIVIGRSRIGSNVAVMHNVTVGNLHVADRGVPQIGDNCSLGTGCSVLGSIRLGSGVRVGANAVVLNDIAEGSTAVGVPAVELRRPNHAAEAVLAQVKQPGD